MLSKSALCTEVLESKFVWRTIAGLQPTMIANQTEQIKTSGFYTRDGEAVKSTFRQAIQSILLTVAVSDHSISVTVSLNRYLQFEEWKTSFTAMHERRNHSTMETPLAPTSLCIVILIMDEFPLKQCCGFIKSFAILGQSSYGLGGPPNILSWRNTEFMKCIFPCFWLPINIS